MEYSKGFIKKLFPKLKEGGELKEPIRDGQALRD